MGGCPRATVGFTPRPLGRESFAGTRPLALGTERLDPPHPTCLERVLPVRRLAVSLPASFGAGLAAGPVSRLVALRFVWVAATSFPEDLHLLSTPMLGTRECSHRLKAVASVKHDDWKSVAPAEAGLKLPRWKRAQVEGFVGPFGLSSPSTLKEPSSSCAWFSMYAAITSSVTFPLLQQKYPRAHT